jgi:hypothetical protein
MAKNPSSTWYFNDWENDPELKVCSLAAQGLWKRLLCIAARSPEHGIVQIGSQQSGLPDGLAQIASAVGRPPDEIAPLIDELLSSGTASRDRKGRIYCRRMVRAAGLSQKMSANGKRGAAVTHGNRTKIEPLPSKAVGKPPPLQDSQSSSSSSHGNTIGVAPSAPAPDGARSGASGLTSDETWRQRLANYDPHKRETWQPFWGPRPDAPGHQPLIPPDLLRWWRAQAAQARTGTAS